MLKYNLNLKPHARRLRAEMTESETALWWRLRRKQLLGVQFYRQKPIGSYIVDFYAPKAKLVVEVDGSQHLERDFTQQDAQRDEYLTDHGLLVLRFSNLQVLQELDAVVDAIFQRLKNALSENPP
jgi:very-short-patch-repair endonuclease